MVRTQRPNTKPSTRVKGVIESALQLHFAETGHTPQFKEVWTYTPVPGMLVEIHGETRFTNSWVRYQGPLGLWIADLHHAGTVRGTPRQAMTADELSTALKS